MSSYITTSSKIHFTPVSPDPEQIVIRDIAHALSPDDTGKRTFFRNFIPWDSIVSIVMRKRLPENTVRFSARHVFLHDASEAIWQISQDRSSSFCPAIWKLKSGCRIRFMKNFWGVFRQRRNRPQFLLWTTHFLYYEFDHYMGEKLQKKPPKLYSAPIFEQKTFSEIEEKYILFSQS